MRRRGLPARVGAEGDAVDDAEVDGDGMEDDGGGAAEVPALGLHFGLDGPVGEDGVLEASTELEDGGVVVAVDGAVGVDDGWVVVDGAEAGEEVGEGAEAAELGAEMEAEDDGVFGDGGAGGEGSAEFEGGVEQVAAEVGVVGAEDDAGCMAGGAVAGGDGREFSEGGDLGRARGGVGGGRLGVGGKGGEEAETEG